MNILNNYYINEYIMYLCTVGNDTWVLLLAMALHKYARYDTTSHLDLGLCTPVHPRISLFEHSRLLHEYFQTFSTVVEHPPTPFNKPPPYLVCSFLPDDCIYRMQL